MTRRQAILSSLVAPFALKQLALGDRVVPPAFNPREYTGKWDFVSEFEVNPEWVEAKYEWNYILDGEALRKYIQMRDVTVLTEPKEIPFLVNPCRWSEWDSAGNPKYITAYRRRRK